MTKKAKIEQFDVVKADRDTMLLVLYDVVNGKFGTPVVLDCREYDKRLCVGTTLKMSASWRAMPLFLIFWHNPGEKNKTPFFMTELELEELCRRDDCTVTQRMLRDAYQTLVRKDYGADPLGDGSFRMVPSGDIVDYDERVRRLS